jgi:putative transposase
MKHTNSIFHQILEFIPRKTFQTIVDKYKGDRRTRSLTCWDQMLALIFCQLSGRSSLRDIVTSFNSQQSRHYHLGTNIICRSSLAEANQKRPVEIFQEAFSYLLTQVNDQLPKRDAKEMVRLIDSTTISLNINQFKWAEFRKNKGGLKLHTVYDPVAEVPVYFEMTNAKVNDRKSLDSMPIESGTTYVIDRAYNDYQWYYNLTEQGCSFVGRMKKDAVYEVVKLRKPEGENIVNDEVIRLSSKQAKKDCPTDLRRVTFYREEDKKTLVFITNDLVRSATEIAELYKQRWQIELFFKWIKQNLKIKKFLGRSENAVLIQVLTALISYLLIKLVKLKNKAKISLQEITRLISINIMQRRSLFELLHIKPKRRREEVIENFQLSMGELYA